MEKFICPLCNKPFSTHRGLCRHISVDHFDKQEQAYVAIHPDKSSLCENCQKKAIFESFRKGYKSYCSSECQKIIYKKHHLEAMSKIDYTKIDYNIEKRKQTCIERYGVDNPLKVSFIKEKVRQTCIETYGVDSPLKNVDIKEKVRQTCITRYGVDNPSKNATIKNKIIAEKKKNLDNGETLFSKSFNTLLIKTGYSYPQQNPTTKETTKQNNIKNHGVDNIGKLPETKLKRKATLKEKYGNENYVNLDFYKDEDWVKKRQSKMYATKKKNNSFHVSNKEDEVYKYLSENLPYIIIRQKYDEIRMPFSVDFYLPQFDLFVDFNGNWTHGKEPFDNTNLKHQSILSLWKQKANNAQKPSYWDNAIYTWTDLDVRKRQYMKTINYLPVYEQDNETILQKIKDAIVNLPYILTWAYPEEVIKDELKYIYTAQGLYTSRPINNKTVLTYQPHFFNKENILFQNTKVQDRLLKNRKKYIGKEKDALTDIEILRGFKESGFHIGFSHFGWQWVSAFIDEFSIKSIYDPCGGWGHRLLGTLHIDYIYNDLDKRTFYNVKSISNLCDKELDLQRKVSFYNEDASTFTPKEHYDAVFTCPPYYNKEIYDYEGSASNFSSYSQWLDWVNKVIQKSLVHCRSLIAIAISTDYKNDIHTVLKQNNLTLIREQPLGPKSFNFKRNSEKQNDCLLIYSK